MKLISQFLAVLDAYRVVIPLSDARISTQIFGDGARITKIRLEGADLRTRSFERSLQWFSDEWPKKATWPEGVARPEPTPPAHVPASPEADFAA